MQNVSPVYLMQVLLGRSYLLRFRYCIVANCTTDEEGNPIIREETGTYIYQDTNNSTDDFERGVVPVMRRNGAKMPHGITHCNN